MINIFKNFYNPQFKQKTKYYDRDSQFEKAYKHAMKVLQDHINKTKQDAERWLKENNNKESYEHKKMKAQFLHTAKRIIEENIKIYLQHPETLESNEDEKKSN